MSELFLAKTVMAGRRDGAGLMYLNALWMSSVEPLHVALPRASLPAAWAARQRKAVLRAGRNVQGAGRPKRSKYVVEAATCARTNFLSTTGLSTTDIPLSHT